MTISDPTTNVRPHARSVSPDSGKRRLSTHAHNFAAGRNTAVSVDISAGTIPLPPDAARCSAVLLELDLASTVLASLGQPWVELTSSINCGLRFLFPRGANGVFCLDISGLCRPDAVELRLTCRFATIGKSAKLRIFVRPRLSSSDRVLVVSPHPDDAELAAFGLYSSHVSAIVSITAGEAGGSNYRRFFASEKDAHRLKAAIRRWDSLTVPLLGGVAPQDIANLGYFDGTLERMQQAPHEAASSRHTGWAEVNQQRRSLGPKLLRPGATATWQSLVADFRHVLAAFSPTVVVLPHPVLDGHSDHRAAANAVLEALSDGTGSVRRVLLYAIHPAFSGHWPLGYPWNGIVLPPISTQMPFLGDVYSHQLAPETKSLKMFALEAMHDLRRGPPAPNHRPSWGIYGSLAAARYAFRQYRLGPSNFFARAVRDSEMFFEIEPTTAAIDAMLVAGQSAGDRISKV